MKNKGTIYLSKQGYLTLLTALLAKFVVGIALFNALLMIFLAGKQWGMFANPDDLILLNLFNQIVGNVYTSAFIGSAACVVIWVVLAVRNTLNLGGKTINSPMGALCNFFIPIVQFFQPYYIVWDLWDTWIDNKKEPRILQIWWGTWWLHIWLMLLLRQIPVDVLPQAVLLLVSSVMFVAQAVSAIAISEIVRTLHAAQYQYWQQQINADSRKKAA